MRERKTYKQMKCAILLQMYNARKSIIKDRREWLYPFEDVGRAYYNGDEWPDRISDLYDLMDSTIYLIISAGHSPEAGKKYYSDIINEVLGRSSIEELTKDIPEDEARELRSDLEVLGFIPHHFTWPRKPREEDLPEERFRSV